MARPAIHPGRFQATFMGASVSWHPTLGTRVQWNFSLTEELFARHSVSRITYECDQPTRGDTQLLDMVKALSVTSLTYALVQEAVGKRGTVVVEWWGVHDVQVAEFIMDGDD